MTFRVMAGLTKIWAGKARELKDGSIVMSGTKYDVTDDVLIAAALWMKAMKTEYVIKTESGNEIILKIEVKE